MAGPLAIAGDRDHPKAGEASISQGRGRLLRSRAVSRKDLRPLVESKRFSEC
jgi:hypothetical protein